MPAATAMVLKTDFNMLLPFLAPPHRHLMLAVISDDRTLQRTCQPRADNAI